MKVMNKFKSEQTGISMIEILIALLLSSILIGGVIQVFVSNKQTYHLQDELSRVQENGRFALEILQRSIRGAGFNNTAVGAFNAATTVDGPNDSIHILSAGTIGCMGPAVVNDLFFISVPPPPALPTPRLTCNGNGTVQPLIDNVIAMQFLYGIDDDGTRTADRYINATAVTAAGLWGGSSVVSVRVGLVLATSLRQDRSRMTLQPMTFATVAANPLLAIFDTDNDGTPDMFGDDGLGAGTNTAPDNRLYRVFTNTITLRNRVP